MHCIAIAFMCLFTLALWSAIVRVVETVVALQFAQNLRKFFQNKSPVRCRNSRLMVLVLRLLPFSVYNCRCTHYALMDVDHRCRE